MGAMQAAKLLAELGTGERLLSARARTLALYQLYTLCDFQCKSGLFYTLSLSITRPNALLGAWAVRGE